jgi:hypothetical protein
MASRGLFQRTLGQVGGNIEWRRADAKDLDAISNRIAMLAAELLTSQHGRRPVRACQGPNCDKDDPTASRGTILNLLRLPW